MPTMRVKKNKNYTTMANYHLRDKGLSLKAKGLLSYMLMLPDDWGYSLSGLISQTGAGKTAIKSALAELKERGYLTVERTKDSAGRFDYVYTIYEKPTAKAQNQPPKAIEPESASPATENVSTDNVPLLNTNILSTKVQSTKNIKDTKVSLIGEPDDSPPEKFGNESINLAFELWENKLGFPQKQSRKNRRATYNLLRNRDIGPEKLSALLDLLVESQKDPYASREVRTIVDYSSLQANWQHLVMWARRKQAQKSGEGTETLIIS